VKLKPPFPRYRPRFPAYLRDPSYYRLAYQLVALYANDASKWRVDPARAVPPSRELLDEGIENAQELAQETRRVLDWFVWRQQGGWSGLRLDKQELRLQRFLAGTLEPCVDLVREGLELERDPETEPTLAFLGRRPRVIVRWTPFSRLPQIGTLAWSYRAFYNLACLCAVRGHARGWDWATPADLCEATGLPAGRRGADEFVHVGLWAMEQSLSLVHGAGLIGLLKLAETDPTLALLQNDAVYGPEFKDLLAQFRVPGTERVEEAPEPEAEGLSPRELRAFIRASDEFRWEPSVAAVVLRAGLAQKREPASSLAARLHLDDLDAWRVLHDLAMLGPDEPLASSP
jgi:hypothetical protein